MIDRVVTHVTAPSRFRCGVNMNDIDGRYLTAYTETKEIDAAPHQCPSNTYHCRALFQDVAVDVSHVRSDENVERLHHSSPRAYLPLNK